MTLTECLSGRAPRAPPVTPPEPRGGIGHSDGKGRGPSHSLNKRETEQGRAKLREGRGRHEAGQGPAGTSGVTGERRTPQRNSEKRVAD